MIGFSTLGHGWMLQYLYALVIIPFNRSDPNGLTLFPLLSFLVHESTIPRRRTRQAECCGIMGVVSTEHATGNDPASDARALLLEVRVETIIDFTE